MDGFSYNNIFDTKGIEYLIIIAFLILIIPFWSFINRKKQPAFQTANAFEALTAGILRIPKGLFYSRNHTWAHLDPSGNARVGLDDFLLHITGEVKLNKLRKKGDFICKGELMAEISKNGKILRINSPLSGKVLESNQVLTNLPGSVNKNTYEETWIYKITPSEWVEETNSYFVAAEAIEWSKREISRFRDFMAGVFKKYSPDNQLLVLQDGGELRDKPLAELPDEVWQEFAKSFLT